MTIASVHMLALWPLLAGGLGLVAFADLLTPLTGAQVRATMVTTLKQLGVPADQWRPGGTYSTLLTIIAYTIATFLGLLAQGLGAGFLETSSGGWLTLLAYYVYGVTRPVATFATGFITLVNTGGGAYSYSAGQATFGNPTTGAQYQNSQPFTLGAGATITIPIASTTTGSAASSAPGAISTLVTAMLGVTCGNQLSVVGSDAMSDPDLRQLCISALGAMSVRGPRSAYAYAVQIATNSVTGAPVNINRWYVSTADHQGNVTVWVASPSGVPDPNDVTGVATSIENVARPDGVTVTVLPVTVVPYSGALTVWCATRPGLQPTVIEAAVAAAIDNYFATYPIGGLQKASFYQFFVVLTGGGLFGSGLDGAVRSADPGIFAIDGAFDLDLATGQVAGNAVDVSVLLVAQRGNG